MKIDGEVENQMKYSRLFQLIKGEIKGDKRG